MAWHSSPPFGSHGPCNHSESSPMDFGTGVQCWPLGAFQDRLLSPCLVVSWRTLGPNCKLHRLLGPCFKTGREWHCCAKLSCRLAHAPSGRPAVTQEPPSEWCSHHASASPITKDTAWSLTCPKTCQAKHSHSGWEMTPSLVPVWWQARRTPIGVSLRPSQTGPLNAMLNRYDNRITNLRP